MVAARIQPVEDEGPRAANVQITRGRRGKTDSQHEISGYRSGAASPPLARTIPKLGGIESCSALWRFLEWSRAASGRNSPTNYCGSSCACGGNIALRKQETPLRSRAGNSDAGFGSTAPPPSPLWAADETPTAGTVKINSGVAQQLGLDAQKSVVARSRTRRQPFGHFFLHQEHRAAQLLAQRQRLSPELAR